MRIWSRLLKKCLMENFIFCAVTPILKNSCKRLNIREIVHSCYTQKNYFEKWCKIHKETAVQDSLFKKISELELAEAVYVRFFLENRRLVKFPGAAGNPLVFIDFSRSPCLSCFSPGIVCRLSRKNLWSGNHFFSFPKRVLFEVLNNSYYWQWPTLREKCP